MFGLGGIPAIAGFFHHALDDMAYTYLLQGSGTSDIIFIDEGSNTMTRGVYIFQVDGEEIIEADWYICVQADIY